MNQVLANLPRSGFPVSIGTGLALESLFTPIQDVYDESREVHNLSDLNEYSLYAFNTSTLLRNIISSVSYKDLIRIPRQEIYNILLEEIDFLSNFFMTHDVSLKFYIHTYKYIKDLYGKDNIHLRKPVTEHQVFTDSIYTYCLDKIRKEDEVTAFHKDIKFNREDRTLIFTHIPFDLLSYGNFVKLDLLESHTGLIKTRKDFNTKYYPLPGDKDMSFLPFMEYLLADVFGDNVMFKPAPLKKRLEIYDQMKKKGVNPLMTEYSWSFIKS